MDESDEELKTQMEYILRIGGLDETAFEVAYEDYLNLCERMHVVPMLFDHNVYVFQMDLNKDDQVEGGKPGLAREVLSLQDDQFQNQVEEDGKSGLDGEVLSLQDDQFQNQVESGKPGLDEEVLSLQEEEQHEAETKNSLQLISENYGDTTETKNSLHIISESYVDSEGDEPS